MRTLLVMMVLAGPALAEDLEDLVSKVDGWLTGQGCAVRVQRHEQSAVWEYELVTTRVDVTQYIVSPLKPPERRLANRSVPSAKGFRIEVMLTDNAPQILGQHITTRGPERQRYYNRDEKGKILSTWMWFSKELPLVYNIEFGTARTPDFAYSLRQVLEP